MSKVVKKGTKGAKHAELDYEVLDVFETDNGILTYVLIQLVTGRHHQIRVQMAHIHHPLVGDRKYNPNSQKGRLCLHAHKLVFTDPRNQKEIIIEAKIPQFISKKR